MKLYKKRLLLSQLLLCKRSIINGFNIVIYSNNNYLLFNILDKLAKIIKQYNYNVLEQKFIHDDMKFNHQISYTIYNKYLITTTDLSLITNIDFNHI